MKAARLAAGLAALLLALGCEQEDSYYDHEPPAGQGSLIVVNNTHDDLSVYLNGREFPETAERTWRAYDLEPGVYRVVLDQQGGPRRYADDIDILEKRLTILDVDIDPNDPGAFDVLFRYD